MPKKVYAVTNVKFSTSEGENFWAAGDPVDHTKFTKDQLKELLDNGAIEIRTVDEKAKEDDKNEELENEVRPTTPDPSTIESTSEAQGAAPRTPDFEE